MNQSNTATTEPSQHNTAQRLFSNLFGRRSLDEWSLGSVLIIGVLALFICVVLPIYTLLSKSVENRAGDFIALTNFSQFFATPSLYNSINNSLFIALLSTTIVTSLSFLTAYGISRTRIPFKGLFRTILVLPILAPSLLPAISLVYLFGNQGIIKELLMGESIYGPIGIIIGSCFWTFPHALMIMLTALANTDARLYESAEVLGASPIRTFFTVTLPAAKYGIISVAFVVFTLVITDFGVPKVIGGQFNVLATDIYKQVIGQQNFEMGATVSVILLLPAILTFLTDRWLQRKQSALLTSKAVPWTAPKRQWLDRVFLGLMLLVSFIILSIILMAVYASLVTFWPYNLSLSLKNYNFDLMDGGGWAAYWNSIQMATFTAIIGTGFIFFQSYLVAKLPGFKVLKWFFHLFAILPLAVPGLVLGLAYIFFFNSPNNPLNGIYGTMTILVVCTISHFYTVCHLTATTALKQIDGEFESVSASLKVPQIKTFWRVTLPVCMPAVLDIASYLFVNAMTTVSAVVFLYSYNTSLASVAVLNMDDAGDIAPAAAMAVMIMLTCMLARLVHWLLGNVLLKNTQTWRKK
ncbi:putative 2-aminoethylphosphonate ABC transporter permease subunit [Marinomonas rhizomae]|uniref:Iron(III) transport system permease protein n=1 Tax=Marinomonas rhizomae TaxID=491948 RepID=A0A366IW87_9GAMM|nr:putative 2-aminoethylphosphonate ABC transporter permease subunit [Marinomonas rhizomae]RBP79043.1 iron(III) transport system permease protein [Marinomonas rhizomae]RNF71265.1 putative 2-aminoethylphosphonate ABC transporter permease subunit [Marinomonas rhizomae]